MYLAINYLLKLPPNSSAHCVCTFLVWGNSVCDTVDNLLVWIPFTRLTCSVINFCVCYIYTAYLKWVTKTVCRDILCMKLILIKRQQYKDISARYQHKDCKQNHPVTTHTNCLQRKIFNYLGPVWIAKQ